MTLFFRKKPSGKQNQTNSMMDTPAPKASPKATKEEGVIDPVLQGYMGMGG